MTAVGVYVAYPCWTYDFTPSTGASVWTNDTGCDGGGGGTPVVADGKLYAPNGFGTYNGDVFSASTGKLLFSYVADNLPAIGSTQGYFLQSGTLVGLKLHNYSIADTYRVAPSGANDDKYPSVARRMMKYAVTPRLTGMSADAFSNAR